MKKKPGFTLVELLVGIALIGILSSSTLVAINPTKRLAQARDAQRKNDIGVLANSLIAYEAEFAQYPALASGCDSSIGRNNGNCPNPPRPSWDINGPMYIALVGQQVFKQLPTDPKNDRTYYYRYYVRRPNQQPCIGTGQYCRYWIGGRLEAPNNPLIPVFRCSNNERLAAGVGCKEVANYNQ